MSDAAEAFAEPVLPYIPATGLLARVRRRSARLLARTPIVPRLERGLVSFTFDDCPLSAARNALPLLEARGWRGTIYASMGLNGTTNHLGLHMETEDYVAASRAGHEIGDHTYSHMDGMRAGVGMMRADIHRNRAAFREAGLPEATTFAYPYGEVTPELKRALWPDFALLRGIHTPADETLDLSLAASQRLYSADMDDVMTAVERAAEHKLWLILFTHDVRDAPSEFGCTPGEFAAVVEAVASRDLDVLPVAQALDLAHPKAATA